MVKFQKLYVLVLFYHGLLDVGTLRFTLVFNRVCDDSDEEVIKISPNVSRTKIDGRVEYSGLLNPNLDELFRSWFGGAEAEVK